MAEGNGMRVDLHALDEVISKLRTLVDNMAKAGETSEYRTDIPKAAFGKTDTFLEADDLFAAHQKCRGDLKTAIKKLEGLIDKFGTTTSKAKDKYHEQEYANKNAMNDDSGKWDK